MPKKKALHIEWAAIKKQYKKDLDLTGIMSKDFGRLLDDYEKKLEVYNEMSGIDVKKEQKARKDVLKAAKAALKVGSSYGKKLVIIEKASNGDVKTAAYEIGNELMWINDKLLKATKAQFD